MKPDFPFTLHLPEPASLEWKPKIQAIVITCKSGKKFIIDYKKLEIFYTPEGK